MYFSTAAFVAALAGIAQAQMVDVQAVQVGSANGSLTFSPDRITAAPGSMVQFQFMGGNHTVTQSTFDNPCNPMASAEQVGIYSGYVPVAASENMGQRPVFTVMVNDTTPIWLYCAQGPHCANGMAMVINENSAANNTRTLENYKLAAATLNGGGDGNNNNAGGAGGVPGGAGGAGGEDEISNPGQGENAQDGNGQEAAGSFLAIPSTLLLAAAGIAMLL